MIAVVNVAATVPVTFLNSLGAGATGLTVTSTARLAGSATTVSGSVTERTNGNYDVVLTLTSVGMWRVTSGTTIDGDSALDLTDIQVVTAAQFDTGMTQARAAKLDSLGAAGVTVQSPVVNQTVTVYQGDDYQTQRPLSWDLTNAPDLTGATVTLLILSDAVSLSIVCSVTSPGTALQTVIAQLTRTQTNSLQAGNIATNYDLSAVLATSGDVTTLVRGPIRVVRDMP